MLNKEKLEKAMELLGDLTQEQKALIAEAAEKTIPEKELYEKLGVDDKKFAEFLKAASDDAVFDQEVSPDELESVAGGWSGAKCDKSQWRDFYADGCAATVDDGSWCGDADACYYGAVVYVGMNSCSRAWK